MYLLTPPLFDVRHNQSFEKKTFEFSILFFFPKMPTFHRQTKIPSTIVTIEKSAQKITITFIFAPQFLCFMTFVANSCKNTLPQSSHTFSLKLPDES